MYSGHDHRKSKTQIWNEVQPFIWDKEKSLFIKPDTIQPDGALDPDVFHFGHTLESYEKYLDDDEEEEEEKTNLSRRCKDSMKHTCWILSSADGNITMGVW